VDGLAIRRAAGGRASAPADPGSDDGPARCRSATAARLAGPPGPGSAPLPGPFSGRYARVVAPHTAVRLGPRGLPTSCPRSYVRCRGEVPICPGPAARLYRGGALARAVARTGSAGRSARRHPRPIPGRCPPRLFAGSVCALQEDRRPPREGMSEIAKA
jgi:hypothetical protein